MMRVLFLFLLSLAFLLESGLCQVPAGDTPQGNAGEGVIEQLKNVTSSKDSTSLDQRFRVSGESNALNKSVSSLCDEISKGVEELLGEKRLKKGFHPIRVRLYSKGNAKRKNLFKVYVSEVEGSGFRVDLIIDIREQIDRSDLEEGVMQAIVMERALRSNPKLDKEAVLDVPRWVSDGLLGALNWKKGNRKRGMYEVLTRKPELFPVEKLFKTKQGDVRDMGETVKALYKASSTAMIMTLSRQEEGKARLSKMLGELAFFEGEMEELLRKHFPAMNMGKLGLQKVWNLQLAEMSIPRMIDIKTHKATEDELRKTLFFRLVGADRVERKIAIKDFDVLLGLESKERIRAVSLLRQELIQLGYRAFPDYQPILAEYGFILTSIVQGKSDGVAKRLEKIAAEREVMYNTALRTSDVLDWYQLTTTRKLKGDFTGYQRLLEQMKREKKRNDESGISGYLNQFEKLMTRSSKR